MTTTIRSQQPSTARAALSKSRFLTGSQCHRLLWWQTHEPDAPELTHSLATQVIFDQGHAVGEEARRRFPGGTLVDLPHKDISGRIALTEALLADEDVHVIYEAAFRARSIFVAVDVLVRNGNGWDLIEVKSTTSAKPEHLRDVAVQRFVLEEAGVHVKRALLMHLNRECRHPDLSNLFTLVDLTHDSSALRDTVTTDAKAMLRMLAGPLPDVEPGDHCTDPRDCPFMARCHDEAPEHAVSELYAIGKKARALEEQGYRTIHDLNASVKLSTIARRQVRAVQQNAIVVEEGLHDALAPIVGPVAFLDFETVAYAIPRYPGCRPYDPVAVQASVHVATHDDRVDHHAHLSRHDEADPRLSLATFLVDVLVDVEVILVWNAGFERRCLELLAEAFPTLGRSLHDIARRLVDLLPVVRNHVYHPAFHGSFSLKSVAPVLAPSSSSSTSSWSGLAIASGDAAASVLYRLFTEEMDPCDRERQRRDLLAYCAEDTAALHRVLRTLRALT